MLTDAMKGLRVLDLSQYIPGPFATLLLSDLGAEVVKVEPPAGDPMRGFGPAGADGVSGFYTVLNRNKTVVRVDLKTEDGRRAMEDLIRGSHVLLESYRPGTLERLGLGRDRLQEIAPHLVHCALSGYGQDGPLRLRAGHDLTYLALSGALAATGPAERPVMPFPPLADHAGALMAVIAILGALLRRLRSGRGAYLDVSLFEAAAGLNAVGLVLGRLTGGPIREGEALTGGGAYYRCYRTADDRFMALAAIEPKFWAAFCRAVDRPAWITRQDEPVPQEALIAEVEALFATRTQADWRAVLAEVDCCCEPVLTSMEAPDHPHVAARGLMGEGAEGLADVLLPIMLDGAAPSPRRPLREAEATDVLSGWAAPR
ncbi:CaiB/BaiF CoA transferase family protein [Roseospira visakhapatnamensis]|uniref:Crotonobetainyl-CoA:carnitine CoA-transferase CaiB-like acyl-CoA transferase n=1 Tax=Roseospira visakhapatnamensis TaxID=390880 RepID=A0A7W6RFM9_9PROT|nr:CoA transferase [Roseospira visakhapatnamensis]MBB4267402.1 crotonobetainyl-CoA:carnitine CoA-transferase CaiB-like acyl-CoA transferase [Roseospira visakhapatnamensis]